MPAYPQPGWLSRRRASLVAYGRSPAAVEFARYFLASVVALAVDWGLFVALTASGLFYLASAAVGFSAGLVVAYAMSVRFVFRQRRTGARFEIAVFCLTGLVGLILTQVLLRWFVADLGIGYALAKVPTAGLVFSFNFVVRKGLLFSSRAETAGGICRRAWNAHMRRPPVPAAPRSGARHPKIGSRHPQNMVAARTLSRTMPPHP
jgi:putative flippase GtrA